MKTFIIAFLILGVTCSDILKSKFGEMPLSNSIFAPSKKSPLSSESEYDDQSEEIVPVRPAAPPPPPPQTQSDLDVLSQLKNYQKKLGTTQKNDSQDIKPEQTKEISKPVQIQEPPRPAQKPENNVSVHKTEEETQPKRSDDFELQKQAQLEKYAKKFHLGGERQVDQDIQQYMPKVSYQPIAIKPVKDKSESQSEESDEVEEKPIKSDVPKKSDSAKHLDGLDFFNSRIQQTTVKQAIPKDESESEEVQFNKKSHIKESDKSDQQFNKKQSGHQDKQSKNLQAQNSENEEDERISQDSKSKAKQKTKMLKPQSDSESESESETDKVEQLKQKQKQDEREMLEMLRKKSVDKKNKARQEVEEVSESEGEIQQPPKSKKNSDKPKYEEKTPKTQPEYEQPSKQKFITASKPKEQDNLKKKSDDQSQKHQLVEFLQKQPEANTISKVQVSKKHDESLNCETSQNHQVQLICQLCEGQKVHLVNYDNWEDVELAEEFSESFGALMGFIFKSIGDGDYLLSRVDQVVCVASASDIQHTVNVEKVLKHFTGRSLQDYESVVDLPSKAEAQVFLLSAEYDSLLKGFSCKKFTLGIKTDLSYDLGDSELLVKQVVLQKAKLKIRYNGILQAKGLSHPAWLEVYHGTHTLSVSSLSLPKEEALVTNIAQNYLGDYARELLPLHRNNQMADLEVQTHISDDNLGLTLNLRRKR